MPVDHDGRIGSIARARHHGQVVGLKDQYQVAFANVPRLRPSWHCDSICGFDEPDHFLAVAIRYLWTNRPE